MITDEGLKHFNKVYRDWCLDYILTQDGSATWLLDTELVRDYRW